MLRSCSLKPELKHDVVIPAGETALALSGALSQRATGVTGGPSTFITRPRRFGTAPSSAALFINLQMWVLLRRWSCNRSRGIFEMSVSNVLCCHKSALSVKIPHHVFCLCWIVSLLHSSLQCDQKFWFQDKCHFWSICGMEIPSCLCFHSSLMQSVYLFVFYYLHCFFLHSCM